MTHPISQQTADTVLFWITMAVVLIIGGGVNLYFWRNPKLVDMFLQLILSRKKLQTNVPVQEPEHEESAVPTFSPSAQPQTFALAVINRNRETVVDNSSQGDRYMNEPRIPFSPGPDNSNGPRPINLSGLRFLVFGAMMYLLVIVKIFLKIHGFFDWPGTSWHILWFVFNLLLIVYANLPFNKLQKQVVYALTGVLMFIQGFMLLFASNLLIP